MQNCSKKLLAKNPDLKQSFNTLISGDISSIKSSYAKCKDLYKSNDIDESDYSDKVKLTKLMEIADTHRCLSYKEISDLMKVDQDEVETLVIRAIECDFVESVIDQPNEVIYFNKVLKRNVGVSDLAAINQDLEKLCKTLEDFGVQAN